MTPQEKLVKFMECKRDRIVKFVNKKVKDRIPVSMLGTLYFDTKDAANLLKLNTSKAQVVWDAIKEAIIKECEGLSSFVCPFCIMYVDKCNVCSYAKNHNQCIDSGCTYDLLFTDYNIISEVLPNT